MSAVFTDFIIKNNLPVSLSSEFSCTLSSSEQKSAVTIFRGTLQEAGLPVTITRRAGLLSRTIRSYSAPEITTSPTAATDRCIAHPTLHANYYLKQGVECQDLSLAMAYYRLGLEMLDESQKDNAYYETYRALHLALAKAYLEISYSSDEVTTSFNHFQQYVHASQENLRCIPQKALHDYMLCIMARIERSALNMRALAAGQVFK